MADFLDTYLYGFDTAVFSFFGSLQSEFLNPIEKAISLYGTFESFLILCVLAIAMCLFKKSRKYGFSLLFALLIGSAVTNVLLKPIVARPRPYVGLQITDYWETFKEFYIFAGRNTMGDLSFPSGHTTVAFETAVSLSITACKDTNRKLRWLYVLIPIAFLVGFSRIYLMVHYPSDVVAGLIVGTLAGTAGALLSNRMMKKQSPEKI